MARAKRKSKGNGRRAASRRSRGSSSNATVLLRADHREVEGWFDEFESARSAQRKQSLAQKICTALTVHAAIEEQIFYPAYLEATGDQAMHHEAQVEHAGAKKLIAEIEGSGPEDEYHDARMSVLSEMVKHHVKEEEKRDGLFARARASQMDLEALGEQLLELKQRLMSNAESPRASRRTQPPVATL